MRCIESDVNEGGAGDGEMAGAVATEGDVVNTSKVEFTVSGGTT